MNGRVWNWAQPHLIEINGLEQYVIYVIRVRSKSKDGHYGNFSDIKVSDTPTGKFVSYLTFRC